MFRIALHWQILAALVLAVLAGVFTDSGDALLGVPVLQTYEFLGTLFLDALRMLVVPLIGAAIISGLIAAGDARALGRLGAKTVAYYLLTGAAAVLVGVILVNLTTPGIIDGQPARELIGLDARTAEVQKTVEGQGPGALADLVLRLIPTNVVGAAAEGQMLGLIFFSLLFGFFITRLPGELAETQGRFWQGVYEVMIRITLLVMRFAPVGVFALVAETVATTGFAAIRPLAWFFGTVLGALAIHMGIVMPLILRWVARVSPWRHFHAMAPALLTAFSTSSSSATLPLTLRCTEHRAGVSNRTTSFVLPLGATVNMDGTALYECVAALFIAQAYGLDLSFVQQLVIVTMALVTSIGVAGIPSASLVAIGIILGAIGLPLEGIGLILAVDRLLDMCRTAVNVFGDSCGAVVIGRSEGETGILAGPVPEDWNAGAAKAA